MNEPHETITYWMCAFAQLAMEKKEEEARVKVRIGALEKEIERWKEIEKLREATYANISETN